MEFTNYTGSPQTAELVSSQIAERFGKGAEYDPLTNCRTYQSWLENGYQVKQGEKAIKSYIIIKHGNQAKRKNINLFYIAQVQKI